MESKSLEALKLLSECANGENKLVFSACLDLEQTIKQDLEAYEQLKQDHDKTLINNGELVVKVTDLQKENQELKRMNKTLFIHNTEFSLGVPNILNENEKLKKAIEILKKSFISIKILGDLKIYNLTNNVALGVYATEKDLELLKEVLKNE